MNKIQEFLKSRGIDYTATFVPFSVSRNAKEKDLSLNWKVTLKNDRYSFDTDYMQGIGHIPKSVLAPKGEYSMNDKTYIKQICEMGKSVTLRDMDGKIHPAKTMPAPEVQDVLECLLLDADALDYPNFEEWASNYDYDTDSRSAEKIYHACIQIAISLRHLIGDDGIQELREIFEEINAQ